MKGVSKLKEYVQPTMKIVVCQTQAICAASVSVPGDNDTWDDEDEGLI